MIVATCGTFAAALAAGRTHRCAALLAAILVSSCGQRPTPQVSSRTVTDDSRLSLATHAARPDDSAPHDAGVDSSGPTSNPCLDDLNARLAFFCTEYHGIRPRGAPPLNLTFSFFRPVEQTIGARAESGGSPVTADELLERARSRIGTSIKDCARKLGLNYRVQRVGTEFWNHPPPSLQKESTEGSATVTFPLDDVRALLFTPLPTCTVGDGAPPDGTPRSDAPPDGTP